MDVIDVVIRESVNEMVEWAKSDVCGRPPMGVSWADVVIRESNKEAERQLAFNQTFAAWCVGGGPGVRARVLDGYWYDAAVTEVLGLS